MLKHCIKDKLSCLVFKSSLRKHAWRVFLSHHHWSYEWPVLSPVRQAINILADKSHTLCVAISPTDFGVALTGCGWAKLETVKALPQKLKQTLFSQAFCKRFLRKERIWAPTKFSSRANVKRISCRCKHLLILFSRIPKSMRLRDW